MTDQMKSSSISPEEVAEREAQAAAAELKIKQEKDDETPGKMKAIIETTQWLTWLETAAEEEDEEEEEEDFNL